MNKLILVVVGTLISTNVIAQQNGVNFNMQLLPHDYVLPSPEASGVTKVADMQVDLSTGIPNIEIPLYTINTGKQTLPISIRYDASGIKVEQQASAVGLGWTLVAGGSITRTVRDKDDFTSSINYESQHLNNTSVWGSLFMPSPSNETDDQYSVAYLSTLSSGDACPDLYMFDVNGCNGRFARIGPSTGIITLPKQNVKISAGDLTSSVPAGIALWAIQNEDGTNYVFGGTANGVNNFETTNLQTVLPSPLQWDNPLPPPQNYITAWSLASMTDFQGTDVINFTYDPTYIESHVGNTNTREFEQDANGLFSTLTPVTYTPDPAALPSVIDNVNSYTIQGIHGNIIRKITFNNGTVEFGVDYTSRQNQDLVFPHSTNPAENNQPQLDNIVIKDKSGNVVREIDFIYSYFVASNFNPSNSPNCKRLKLTSIIIKNGSAVPETYQFQYDENNPLPAKDSYAQDHWGYYNGATTNTTLIPSQYLIPVPALQSNPDYSVVQCNATGNGNSSNNTTDYTYNHFNGANREANSYATSGVLNKIIYPTGGSVQFDFENNTLPNDVTNAETTYVAKQAACQAIRTDGNNDAYCSGDTNPSGYTFTIENNALTQNGVYAMLTASLTLGDMSSDQEIHNLGTYIITGNLTNGSAYNLSGSVSVNAGLTYCQDNIILYPGTYYVSSHETGNGVPTGTGIMSCYFKALVPEVVTAYTANTLAGGLRIKKITYNDNQGNSRTKNYSYNDIDHPNLSSGFTHYPINVESNYKRYGIFNDDDPTKCPQCYTYDNDGNIADHILCMYLSVPVLELLSTTNYDMGDGNYVHYKYVTVTESNGENGKELFEHYNAGGKYLPWEDGLLLNHKIYDANNFLVKEESLNYNLNTGLTVQPTSYTGYNITDYGHHPCMLEPGISGAPGYPINFHWYPYLMRPEWVTLQSKKTTEYFPAGALTQTENYTYDPLSMEIASVTKSMSDGRSMVQNFKYPTNYVYTGTLSNALQGLQALQNIHANNQVVEKFTSIIDNSNNSSVINGEYINYNPFTQTANSNTSITAIKNQLYSLETTSPITNFQPSVVSFNGSNSDINIDPNYKLQTSIVHYDSRLNATEIKEEHGGNTALIWMYNKQYLTANAKNATQYQIGYTGFETPETGNWNYQPANDIASDHLTGNACYPLSAGDITIHLGNAVGSETSVPGNYVVSYWIKGGSATVNGTAPTSAGTIINGWWTYCEHILNGITWATVSGTGLIDELRIYPVSAQMETATYDPLVGVTARCDVNNLITFYKYDALGRLILITDQYGNIVKKYDYGIETQE